ncbi:hypothetical protein Scep_016716 [Stephania cephalantha]|uniref:Uncharacterized protein n=1 Tax=Stephania cephalantha TaxID=152367 RepID=A0AAP0IPG8_9MAGN
MELLSVHSTLYRQGSSLFAQSAVQVQNLSTKKLPPKKCPFISSIDAPAPNSSASDA